MSEQIRWTVNIQAVSGPSLSATGIVLGDTYSKGQVVVPARAAGVDGSLVVTLDTTGTEFLFLKANLYVDPADDTKTLQYDINEAGTVRAMTGPLVFLGADSVKLLASPVTKIKFTNPTSADISVDIIAAGDATP